MITRQEDIGRNYRVHSDPKVFPILKRRKCRREAGATSRAWLRSRALETATVSTCRYTREGGSRAARVYPALYERVRGGWEWKSVTTGAKGGKGGRDRREGAREGERRVPARGIIALLQIIGQTPAQGERVFRVPCICTCVYVHACRRPPVGSVDSGTLHARCSVYFVDTAQGVTRPRKLPRRPWDWSIRVVTAFPFSPSSSPSSLASPRLACSRRRYFSRMPVNVKMLIENAP